MIVQVPGPSKWFILGVSLTHLVESRDRFLKVEIVHNIFQWDILKNMWEIKNYDPLRILNVDYAFKLHLKWIYFAFKLQLML